MSILLIALLIVMIAALLLFILGVFVKTRSGYQPRHFEALSALQKHRVSAVEQGLARHIVLGKGFGSGAFLGLGLFALEVLPIFSHAEQMVDGRQQVSTASGSVYLLASQILQGDYTDGVSSGLGVSSPAALPGLTGFSYTAGLLPSLMADQHGSLALFGDFGPEAALWAERVADEDGHVFAAAGTLTSQAVLLLNVRDLLIGEEIFATKGLLHPTSMNLAALQTEDVLRILLMAALLIGAVMKLVGVL